MKNPEVKDNISIVVGALMAIGPSTVVGIVKYLEGELTKSQVQSAVVKPAHIVNTGEDVTINGRRNCVYRAKEWMSGIGIADKPWFLSK